MSKKMFNQFLCSSLMLPEHREALNRHHAEQRKREETRCPCIDEQQYALWERLLATSLQQGKKLLVCYMNEQGEHSLQGVVCKYAPLSREIFIRDAGAEKRILLSSIVSLEEIHGDDAGCC